MNRLLIGSSNVIRTYCAEKFKGYPPYKAIKCTRIEVYKVLMDDIKNEKEVIIAVIENFLCDAVKSIQSPTTEQINEAIDSAIGDFMEVTKNTASKLPNTRFAIAQPIGRPRDIWYGERFDGICRSFVAGITAMGLVNVSKLEGMPKKSQFFIDDMVHLTKESGEAYVNGLLHKAGALFTAEIIDLENETSKKPERSAENANQNIPRSNFEQGIKDLDAKLTELNQNMFRRRFQDSLVMARIREDVDFISNTNKEDKMMISGLTSKTPRPSGREEIKKWLKDMVTEALEAIETGSSKEIIFISQGRSNNRDVPLAEVRMTSKEVAIRLRKLFAQKKKAGKDFGRIYVSNCVTLATRVRIDILKAMAKKFTSDREDIHVIGYSSRPVLHVKPKIDDQKQRWLSFSDALVRYGAGLEESDLGDAYRKSGLAFKGQLEQNFVVLHDNLHHGRMEKPKNVLISNVADETTMGSPRKRQREEVDQRPVPKNSKI